MANRWKSKPQSLLTFTCVVNDRGHGCDAVSKDDYLRQTGGEDHIDDKTVFIIKEH
jgi:hypothetical protein